MGWDVEYTDELGVWWDSLDEGEQDSVAAYVRLLEEPRAGAALSLQFGGGDFPTYTHMRELRVQHQGRPYRVLYAFDPRRTAILLIGGDKTGNDRWYEEYVPGADQLYDEHLQQLREEGLL